MPGYKTDLATRLWGRIKALPPLVYLYAVFCMLAAMTLPAGWGTYIDTKTYVAAWDNIRVEGLDIFRAPLYPAILGLLRDLCGPERMYLGAAVLQYAVFGLTIVFFYRTVCLLVPGRGRIAFCATLLYILSPTTYLWCRVAITESLSISLMVLWFYCLVAVWSGRFKRRLVAGGMVVLVLLYLIRPSFVYLTVVGVVASLLYWVRQPSASIRRKCVFALMQLLPAVVVPVYCAVYKAHYGVFTPSCVADINRLQGLAFDGGTAIPDMQDQALRERMDAYVNHGGAIDSPLQYFMDMCDTFGYDKVHEATGAICDKGILSMVSVTRGRFFKMLYSDDSTAYTKILPVDNALMFLSFRGREMLAVLLAFSLYTAWHIIRRRRPWLSLLIATAIAGNVAVSLLGGQAEWMRLTATSAPLMMCALAIMAANLTVRKGYSPC